MLEIKDTNHLLIWVLFALLNVGDGLWTKPVGDLIGAQGDTKDVLMVAVLILDTVGWWKSREKGRKMWAGYCLTVNDRADFTETRKK